MIRRRQGLYGTRQIAHGTPGSNELFPSAASSRPRMLVNLIGGPGEKPGSVTCRGLSPRHDPVDFHPELMGLSNRLCRVKPCSPDCVPAGCMVVSAVGIGRRMLGVAGRAFNVDDALCRKTVQPHQRNGSAHVPAGTPQAFGTRTLSAGGQVVTSGWGSKNSPFLSIACMITASLRATATAARLKPILSRSLSPHVRKPLSARTRVRMIAAAS